MRKSDIAINENIMINGNNETTDQIYSLNSINIDVSIYVYNIHFVSIETAA